MRGRHRAPQPPPSPDLDRRIIWVLGGLLTMGVLLVAVTVFGGDGGEASTTTASSTTLEQRSTTTTASPTSTSAQTTTSRATTTTVAASSTTDTTIADPLAGLVLTEQGIGSISFGADAEATISEFSSILAPPNEDSGWVDSFSYLGTCPGTEARLVRWVSLQAFFTNGATDWAPEGTRHFFHYSHSVTAGGGDVLALSTDKDLALGSTIGDLKAAYGSQVTVTDDPLFDTLWEVNSEGPAILWGSASTATDDGTITSINGGFGCGE